MLNIKTIYDFYLKGFQNMTLGKHLWKIVLLKIFIILVVLQYFVYDVSLENLYQTNEQKAAYVYQNLKGK